jgi:uncharacterized membrane protein YcaP (DUF421 family)
MKPEEIRLGDWARMFMGEAPPAFLLELIIRLVFIFLLLIIAMRLLGLRMAAQLNRIEMIALFSLAAAIGVPLQSPDRGLLPAVVIAIVVVVVGKLMVAGAYKSQKFEQITEDDYSLLIKDGVVQMKELKRSRVTVERLFAQLRRQSIRHLGEVERLYFEASGDFTLIRAATPAPGLQVLPNFDEEFIKEQQQVADVVCCACGNKMSDKEQQSKQCSNCKGDEWQTAIV